MTVLLLSAGAPCRVQARRTATGGGEAGSGDSATARALLLEAVRRLLPLRRAVETCRPSVSVRRPAPLHAVAPVYGAQLDGTEHDVAQAHRAPPSVSLSGADGTE